MTKFGKLLLFSLVATLLFSVGVYAQEPELISESSDTGDVEVVSEIPSSWGLFWSNLKENFSIWTTFDPVEKAEKRLQYAEQKMEMAEMIMESGQDEKMRKLAERAVNRATSLLEKVDLKKDKWLEKSEEKVEKLVENLTRHQVNRELILDKLEGKLPDEKLEGLREMREDGLKASQRLLNAIDNENVPERIREHLEGVKEKIEEHAEEVVQFRAENQELLKKVEEGDGEAGEVLEHVRTERREEVRERYQTYQDEKALEDAGQVRVEEQVRERVQVNKEDVEDNQETNEEDDNESGSGVGAKKVGN